MRWCSAGAAITFLALVAAGCSAKGFAAATDAGEDASPFKDTGTTPPVAAEFFGHTATTLYRVDPISRATTSVGNFDGCTYVNDIAIDKRGVIYGTTGTSLWMISGVDAHCTLVAKGVFPNSLSFVPANVLGPDETLVGFEGADYVSINTSSGAKNKVGSMAGGYTSSGDVVSVIDGATYVTVKGNGCGDCLVEVDPKTGSITKNWGDIGHVDVFGIAFWAGKVYGFANDGTLFEATLANGAVQPTTIPVSGPVLAWAGAGSTTAAPLVAPN
jgi:hypothetical protein